jgi:eukaryotic-like serine/threonine-protein kinase
MPQLEKRQIGRYEILEEIGRGAMGVVFKARDPLIGRAVAVKTITSGVAESADLLERFNREAQAAGGLQHPNIVTIYELAESGGVPFIAMEYLEGESLEKIIAHKPALPLATKLGYVVQTCRALDYAHRRGVIHRDVKPANIVVTHDGIVKVVDFGIARLAATTKTQTGTLLGTLAYMSPEQLRGQNADARCDIWAMGVVLYELIAYQRPFAGENHAALLLSILQNEPAPIRQFVPECPAPLERTVLKALRKDEKERYQSMEALLKDLEKLRASLTPGGSQAAVENESPSATADQPHLATQRIDLGASKVAAQILGAKSGLQPAPTVILHAPPTGAGAASGKPETRQPVKNIAKKPPQPKPHAVRTALTACAMLAIIALGAFAVLHRDEVLAVAAHRSLANITAKIVNLASRGAAADPLPGATAKTPISANSNSTGAEPSGTADGATTAVAGDADLKSAPSSASPIEDQQRYVINLAQQAADRQDYKGALQQLDEAAKLNGPLNDSIVELRRQFSAQSHDLELERVARDEQTLWDKAMEYVSAGDLDDAEETLREILTLPEGGHRWSEAARYVDEAIPELRQEEQLWATAQLASKSRDPGHFLSEVKALDEVLIAGGRHEQGARQRRDAVIAATIREDAAGHGLAEPVISNADQWQVTRLKNSFDDLVQRGDAPAVEKLQQLQSEFKSLADARGPLAIDALDYLNNVIPMAQKHIQDRLAVVQANASPNAAYLDAVKEYNRAVAMQNAAMLRDLVLPAFRQIAQAGGVRAKEARRYIDVLVPAALKKSAQQE